MLFEFNPLSHRRENRAPGSDGVLTKSESALKKLVLALVGAITASVYIYPPPALRSLN